MINNTELIREINNAGFPKPENWRNLALWREIGTDEEFYIPRLDHLIEVCGDMFRRLERQDNGTFSAYANPNPNTFESGIARGETPTEAVAKLWLERIKKQTHNG